VKYKVDSEIFSHYAPKSTNYALKVDSANLGTINTDPIKFPENL
jgi:hypothetical protein